ncbi:MAG: response regulator transcription factor [Erysipelotrichaceae bacterium]|nr:response regulator transcription factor [Erysipelotrichaceae bacterium]
MNKILIVDDEQHIREVVVEYAKANGFEVFEATNGEQALKIVKSNDIDCMILDLMMPVMDGFTALKKIKQIRDVPTIVLSAREEEYDKLSTFDLGADDYVTKPFSPKELMARIKRLIERTNNQKGTITVDGLTIDVRGRTVRIDGQKLEMTPKEIELLIYMVENRNMALSREKLLSSVWDYDYYGDDRTIDTHIKMLRKSLGEYKKHIVTVRGLGYKFED